MSDKKKLQLGMNPGTASNRLVKDLLWNFICESGQNKCHQCGNEMERDNFSVEHVKPWLDSEDPVGLFFDLKNISFSHRNCNSSAARRPTKKSAEEKYAVKREWERNNYCPEKRRERYKKTGY